MLERADRLTTPPIVGRFYLVPTVFYVGWHIRAHWPLLGPRHEDTEHLKFQWEHYHVDIRFCSKRLQEAMSWCGDATYRAANTPLMSVTGEPPPAHPIFRRMKCQRADHAYPYKDAANSVQFQSLWASFTGRQCKSAKSGWICPHRNFPLGSIAPVGGVITCPLHGLRIGAQSGMCLRQTK